MDGGLLVATAGWGGGHAFLGDDCETGLDGWGVTGATCCCFSTALIAALTGVEAFTASEVGGLADGGLLVATEGWDGGHAPAFLVASLGGCFVSCSCRSSVALTTLLTGVGAFTVSEVAGWLTVAGGGRAGVAIFTAGCCGAGDFVSLVVSPTGFWT